MTDIIKVAINQVIEKKLDPAESKDVAELTGNKKFKLYRGKGCDQCGDSGYKGRMGVYEVLNITEKIGKLILERSPSNNIEKTAIEDGMVTMKQDGYLKAMEGFTTVEEVLRVAQDA